MTDIVYAFQMTIELWVFVGILGVALIVEEVIQKVKQ